MPNRFLYSMLALILAIVARAEDSVTAGKLQVQPPTLICLGFLWEISGDDDKDATVTLQYRKTGASAWRSFMPLCRLSRGPIPNAFCGSIMDLEPGTEYEVRLELKDPDGVKGEAVQALTTSTRPVPKTPEGGRVLHVYPPKRRGKAPKGAFMGLMAAINGRGPSADDYPWTKDHVRPGDTILMHAGEYKGDWHDYRDPLGHWQHGTYQIPWDGTAEKPITVKPAGDGEVIIDGRNTRDGAIPYRLFNMLTADHWIFEELTIRNAFIAFHAGDMGVAGCKGLTIRNCRLENVGNGVLGLDGRCADFTILDNLIIGSNDGKRIHSQANGASGRSDAGYAVNLIGTGHAVGYNRVERFWDGINVNTNAMAEPEFGQQAYCIDFYNNDLKDICDNFIESDGGLWNIRILRNRCVNSIAAPLSIQPVYAGPVYWIRNIVLNAGGPGFKVTSGDNVMVYHNTLSKHWTMALGVNYGDIRNNAFMGPIVARRERYRGKETALKMRLGDKRSILDHNAYRVGMKSTKPFQLILGRRDKHEAANLAELQKQTGYEAHGIEVSGYDVFVKAAEPKNSRDHLVDARDFDLRPAPGSPLIDAAAVIPGINDDFAGKAPDIGALEAGKPAPQYGPRSK